MYENDKPHRKKFPWCWFRPDYIADSVTTIDYAYLQSQGIQAIYIDLDGTVVSRGTYEVSADITTALRNQPLKVYIATNRPKSRDLKDLKDRLNADGVVHPREFLGKPFPRYYRQSLRERGIRPRQAIMIGDRYLQDIWGANSARLHTLLVRKLDAPTNWFDRILSGLERRWTTWLLRNYRPVK